MFHLDVEVIDPPLPERCRLESPWLSPAAPRFVFSLFCVSYPLRVQLGGSVTEILPVPSGTPSATPRLPSGIPHPVVGHASVGVWAKLPATAKRGCHSRDAYFTETIKAQLLPPTQNVGENMIKVALSPPRGALCVLPKSVSLLLLTIYIKEKYDQPWRSNGGPRTGTGTVPR